MQGTSILGTRVQRVEDPKLLTVGGSYVADIDVPGAAHVVYVRSPIAHASITSIDTSAARLAPGVVAVFTADDLDLPALPPFPFVDQRLVRPRLAQGSVRYVGDPVVAVVAETHAQAVDAADLVEINYDPRPVVVDVEDALAPDAPKILPEIESNVAAQIPAGDPADFSGCDVVVEQRIVNSKLAPVPMEPRAMAVSWGDDGRVTVYACTQMPHMSRMVLAAHNGFAESDVRVVTPDVGGGFGSKFGAGVEESLLPVIAKKVGRPLRWVETRTESMLNLPHGRAQIHRAKIGGTRDGRILAYQLDVTQDAGAYPNFAGMMPQMTRTMTSGVYDIRSVEFSSSTVATNTVPIGAYRGAGRPEAAAAIERMVDLFAAEVGLDPIEVRRRNFIAPASFPHTTPTGANYDSGAYEAALDKVLAAAGYDDLRAEQARRRASGDQRLLGIGVAVYVEITNPDGGGEFGSIEVHDDGRAIVRTGTSSHGQGHETAFAMVASDITGIPIERIEVHHGDTDEIKWGGGTGGSRSLQAGGSAVQRASQDLVELAREKAANLLEAAVEDVVLDTGDGEFHVSGAPGARRVGWGEVAAAEPSRSLFAEFDFTPGGATFPFGAHVAVVEIDAETGRVEVVRFVAVDDAGRVINPLLLEGQIHGGLAGGIGQALMEEFRYDEDGNPLTATLADYGILSAAELPSFEVHEMETPTDRNPLGAKGIGESGTIGSTPAVQNAVCDALAHLGVRHVDMPFTAERVWRAIHAAAR
jgi:carbon-monoxide dehydrogenase large subunit